MCLIISNKLRFLIERHQAGYFLEYKDKMVIGITKYTSILIIIEKTTTLIKVVVYKLDNLIVIGIIRNFNYYSLPKYK